MRNSSCFHNVVPTLSLLHHRHMAPSATCSRCGANDETILHCLRDCRFSKSIWFKLGFTDQIFFTEDNAHNWIKNKASGRRYSIFFAGIWWTWRHRNLMRLNHETWSLHRLSYHIQSTTETIEASFQSVSALHSDIIVR